MSPEQGIAGWTNAGEFMLFGVRVVVDSMRKSVSLNNLSQYEHRLDSSSSNNDVIAYASADEAVPNSPSVAGACVRERKRGTPWTEEEHKLFLIGLQKVGKGDWRGIAKNFVKSRTPTQVASHAQKYFLRRSSLNRRRRRSSLFDITTDTVVAIDPIHEHQMVKENNIILSQSPPPSEAESPSSKQTISITKSRFPTNIEPMANFDLNEKSINDWSSSHLSLNLSLSISISSSDMANSGSTMHSGFHAMQTLKNGDSMISVV